MPQLHTLFRLRCTFRRLTGCYGWIIYVISRSAVAPESLSKVNASTCTAAIEHGLRAHWMQEGPIKPNRAWKGISHGFGSII